MVVAVVIAKDAVKRKQTEQAAATGAEGVAPMAGSGLAAALSSGRPTMADFGKGWCQPCKAMVPVLEQAARDYAGKANIIYVDMEQYATVALAYGIQVMPTQIFFDAKGAEVDRHMGYMAPPDIEKALARVGVKK